MRSYYSTRIIFAANAIVTMALLAALAAACDTQDNSVTSNANSSTAGDEKTYLANTYCNAGQQNAAFDSREDACRYYQAHFAYSTVGKPDDILDYITTSKRLCDSNRAYCLKYWTSVSNNEHLRVSYPGINIDDPIILTAKKDTVIACLDDSHPVTPDGLDAKPDVCLQAARLMREDKKGGPLLTTVEKKACDIGDADECHYATMAGETVDIRASEILQAQHEQARREHGGESDSYGPGLKQGY